MKYAVSIFLLLAAFIAAIFYAQTQINIKTVSQPVVNSNPSQSNSPDNGIEQSYNNASPAPSAVLNKKTSAKPLPSNVIAPPPLKKKTISLSGVVLTVDGVINETNKQRSQGGLSLLVENEKLKKAALVKLNDMVRQGYFEHVSPQGVTPGDLVSAEGYEFIVIAENLAVGDFKSNTDLVDSWMNSPGHRANILNGRFTEIGVAVAKGMHEGRVTWYAVQEFGRPLTLCEKPDESINSQIIQNQSRLNALSSEINLQRAKMDELRFSDPVAYNQNLDNFNSLVDSYNSLLEPTRSMASQYNLQVERFNACLGR